MFGWAPSCQCDCPASVWLIAAIPNIKGAVWMYSWCAHSDATQERSWHFVVTSVLLSAGYDRRLRDLVDDTGDVTIATDLGVPRSTARRWLGKARRVN